jgi:CubicO group peptidase (beta-lactamase class C family)
MNTFQLLAVMAGWAVASVGQQKSDATTSRVTSSDPDLQALQQLADERRAAYNAKDGAKVAAVWERGIGALMPVSS